MARSGEAGSRGYKRTDRLNELLREVVAEELERIGDDDDRRLRLVTITGVATVADLAVATVYYATLGDEAETAAGLESQRHRLQRAVASQVRARRTPILSFRADPGILAGRQVDALLRDHPVSDVEVPVDPTLYRDLDGTLARQATPSDEVIHADDDGDEEAADVGGVDGGEAARG
ncbi:MAG: ribosome-binding factor A [Acidimicrobiales bacterium]